MADRQTLTITTDHGASGADSSTSITVPTGIENSDECRTRDL